MQNDNLVHTEYVTWHLNLAHASNTHDHMLDGQFNFWFAIMLIFDAHIDYATQSPSKHIKLKRYHVLLCIILTHFVRK